jgi:porin
VLSPPAGAADAEPTRASASWLVPALSYDGAALANVHGGLRTGGAYVGNLHLKLTTRDDAIGWPGTSTFLDVLSIHGGQPGSLVGDAQGASSLEGPTGTQIEELWVQHNFKDSGASLLAGIYDLNSEFYRLQAAGLFLNRSFGIGPEFAHSGVEGPSIFPRTSAGLRFALKPAPDLVWRTALLDGVPVVRPDGSHGAFHAGDGLLFVSELALLSRTGASDDRQPGVRDRIGRFSSLAPYDDKLAFGAWRYTAWFADLSDTDPQGGPRLRRGSSGAYVIGERLLVGGGTSGKRLAAFAQAGIADPQVNRFGSYFGTGITANGWGPIRESDQLGLSIAQARNGSHYFRARASEGGASPAETTVELTYLTQLRTYLTVQPDLQYVIHPDTDRSIASAWVLQLRFEIAF